MKTVDRTKGTKLLLILLCFAAFVLYGMYFNGFGTNSSTIMSFFEINEAQNGVILTVQSIGCIVLTIILALFGERINKITGIFLGLLIMGIAGVLIGFIPNLFGVGSGYIFMLLFSLVAGVGYIIIDLLMNGVFADVFPDKKNTLLPYVHAFYSVGAMLAPIFVTAVVNPDVAKTFARPYLFIGAAAIVAGVVLAFTGKKVLADTPYADMTEIRSRAKNNPAEIFRDGRAWMYLLACFFYIGCQTGIATWLPSFCNKEFGLSFESAGLIVTLYFLGSLIMRFLSPVMFKQFGVRKYYIASIILSAVVFPIFLFVPMPLLARQTLIVLIGLLQGSAVPALVILCCDDFPERTASASSLFVLGVSLSSFIVPAVMGYLIKTAGNAIPMIMIIAFLVLSVLSILPIPKMKRA